jgi:FKBP-type peptidyl-prolyl cis-trans isomerase FklB
MKMKLVAVSVLTLMMTAPFAQETMSLNTDVEQSSYAIGVDLGRNIKRKNIEISSPAMCRGITDGMGDGPLLLTDEVMQQVLAKFQKNMMAKATAQFETLAKENQAKGQKFLQENKAKSGVITLPSGLQYKVITEGKGKKPTMNDTVSVEYSGSLIDGTVFDSTEKSGQPAKFMLNQVIPGWTEALKLMRVGSTWELYIPSSLAYGARSVGDVIGPNETLVFKVTLKSIEPAEKKKK